MSFLQKNNIIDPNFNLGSFWVTGVKKVIFIKNATPPTYYVAQCHVTYVHDTPGDLLQK